MEIRERQTKQKKLIYEAMSRLDHPTATEVYGYVHERYPTVSRATVFRVLSGFAESGRALELKVAGKDTRYDYNVTRHSHAHCRICGRVADVTPREEIKASSALCDDGGFIVESVVVEFVGYCPSCYGNRAQLDKN